MAKTKTVYLDEEGLDYPPTYFYDNHPPIDNHERMLAELLMDEVCFINSRKFYCDYKKEIREETIVTFVICNDIFAWACADCESVTLKELPELYKLHIEDPCWGSIKWCCFKRNMKPQFPVENDMKKDGVWCEKMEALPANQ